MRLNPHSHIQTKIIRAANVETDSKSSDVRMIHFRNYDSEEPRVAIVEKKTDENESGKAVVLS